LNLDFLLRFSLLLFEFYGPHLCFYFKSVDASNVRISSNCLTCSKIFDQKNFLCMSWRKCLHVKCLKFRFSIFQNLNINGSCENVLKISTEKLIKILKKLWKSKAIFFKQPFIVKKNESKQNFLLIESLQVILNFIKESLWWYFRFIFYLLTNSFVIKFTIVLPFFKA
jgi:hypothetical protein